MTQHYCGTGQFPHEPGEGCSEFATPAPEPDWFDRNEDAVPVLIQNSRWSCLDCPEPTGAPWESATDHCHAAHEHHRMTGHRVNGQVEVRYRAQSADSVFRSAQTASEATQ
jgi:hypothetical protein